MDNFEFFFNLILNSKYSVVFTGAGISTESGIPQFRGKNGLWEKYSPEIFGTLPGLISQFLISPFKVVNFIYDFTSSILNSKPNISHLTLAELERRGYIKTIITQNIDNLHQEAGSKNVIELHGNIYRWECKKCHKIEVLEKEKLIKFIEELKNLKSRRALIKHISNFIKCNCGGRRRPNIIFFGELLPEKEFEKAEEESRKSDLFIIIGTSGIVKPASNLPYLAKKTGAKIVEINTEKSFYENISDIVFDKPSTEVFSYIWNKIKIE
ncbi:MAG: NAD-dependent protein deacylase [Candidatus Omnitrophica bacterium]|nr:NAD-dependent protein deacylase [Candidatus Omnitrophota bacterium]MCM8806815.1 NAD-dependent protein deacylase [Candidatus Omnitrophota bacterium]